MKIGSLARKLLVRKTADTNRISSANKSSNGKNIPYWLRNLLIWLVIVGIAVLINIEINGIDKYRKEVVEQQEAATLRETE